jgi:hypothetical protein
MTSMRKNLWLEALYLGDIYIVKCQNNARSTPYFIIADDPGENMPRCLGLKDLLGVLYW